MVQNAAFAPLKLLHDLLIVGTVFVLFVGLFKHQSATESYTESDIMIVLEEATVCRRIGFDFWLVALASPVITVEIQVIVLWSIVAEDLHDPTKVL